MDKLLAIALFLAIYITLLHGFCISTGPYHLASKAFAEGVGLLNTSSPCVYGNASISNSSCPVTCKTLIVATWGDCYCKDPFYTPKVSDFLVRNLTVFDIFQLLSTSKWSKSANCRDWLNEADQVKMWKCT